MKSAVSKLLVALTLIGCSKITDSGPYTITGTLLNNCEKQEPVANEELYFLVDWDAPESERFATTDAKGRFEYTFDGPPNNESVIGGSIRLTNEKVVLCGIPNFSLDKNTNAGVIYANPPKKAKVTFNIKGDGFTNKDTVILSLSFHTDLRKISQFRIPGPFNKQVVAEEWTRYASSGTKTMPSFSRTKKPFVRRLNGTYGTVCRWQILNENGDLSGVNYESLLMTACERSGTFQIDLENSK